MLSSAERRLSAIMFTDVVGYGAMTQRNEELALELLQLHRDMLRPMFRSFGGNEIKTMGDAFLVEFQSALQAVKCAISIQRELKRYNASVDSERSVRVRIGLHIGDVVFEQNDVYGDGVNLASRIYAQAEPGGICLTRSVYDQIHNKVDVAIRRLGPQRLKSIQKPVELFAISFDSKSKPWYATGSGRAAATLVGAAVLAAGYWAFVPSSAEPPIAPPDTLSETGVPDDTSTLSMTPSDTLPADNVARNPDSLSTDRPRPRTEETPPRNDPPDALRPYLQRYANILRGQTWREVSSAISRESDAGRMRFGTRDSIPNPEGALVVVLDAESTSSTRIDGFYLFSNNTFVDLKTRDEISTLASRYSGRQKREIWVRTIP